MEEGLRGRQKIALAGTRTRIGRVAGDHSTLKPPVRAFENEQFFPHIIKNTEEKQEEKTETNKLIKTQMEPQENATSDLLKSILISLEKMSKRLYVQTTAINSLRQDFGWLAEEWIRHAIKKNKRAGFFHVDDIAVLLCRSDITVLPVLRRGDKHNQS